MKTTIHRVAVCLFTAIVAAASMPSMAQNTHSLPLVLPDGGSHTGFVRIVNRSGQSGTVRILAIDDTGEQFGPVTLSIDSRETVNFNSRDLEQGNESKGLSAGVGDGSGYWRLIFDTDLSITPLAYIRTSDGFVTAMHEVAPETEADSRRYRVAFFNPASNRNQVSRLRLINLGTTQASIEITGNDATGASRGPVRLSIPAGGASMVTAQALEAGTGLDGRLGDGTGKWKLIVSSNVDIQVMNLLATPTGHLANLSTIPEYRGGSAPTPPEPPTPTGDDHGNTRATATLVRVPSTTAGNLETGDDIDFFRFDLPSWGRLGVYTTGNTNTYGTFHQLNGWRSGTSDHGTGNNFRIDRRSTGPGMYYIEVSSADPGGISGTGAYRLHVEFSESTTRCGAGDTVTAGNPCVYRIGSQTFTLSIQGTRVCFVYGCAGGNFIFSNATINGVTITLVTEGSGTSRRIAQISQNLVDGLVE